MAGVFGFDQAEATADNEQQIQQMYARIRQLKLEKNFQKKIILKPVAELRCMIEKGHSRLSVTSQCCLLGIYRSGLY